MKEKVRDRETDKQDQYKERKNEGIWSERVRECLTSSVEVTECK